MLLRIMQMMADAGSYEERKVARNKINGLVISTCCVSDCNGYETAVCDAGGAHPVERYDNQNDAARGHKRWVKKSKTLKKIISLGHSGWQAKSRTVRLKRLS